MVKYVKNRAGLYYPLKSYNKSEDVLTLIDPHTHEEFKVVQAKETLKLGVFKVVNRDPS